MIQNVVFDIGNVLVGFVWEEFYHSFGFSEATFEKVADATVRSPFWSEMDRGELSDEELLAGFIRNDPSVEKEIRTALQNVKGMIRRYDYSVPWIRELKKQGYHVYVISNFAHKAHRDCMDALDFLKELDGGILSYQVKLIKPAPEIYRLLCSRYGLKAEECVFIDDVRENVEAAEREGMKGIIFESREQAQEALKAVLDLHGFPDQEKSLR